MILSALLWTIGFLFFIFIFLFIAISILIIPPERVYPVLHYLFKLQLIVLGLPLKVMGKENFDRSKTYIIMGNHESLFDIFVIPAGVPVHFVGVEAARHFSWPFWGWITRRWGNIPIPRSDLSRAIESIEKATAVLQQGTSVGILPEGTRTLDGEMNPFKKGPFHLSLAAKTDIMPFALSGLFEYKSKHSWKLNPRRAYIKFGKPISYETFSGLNVDELSELVRNEIQALKTSLKRLETFR